MMAETPTFKEQLKAWRGKRTQNNAADILDVDLDTYRKWEQGASEPHETPSKAELIKRMLVDDFNRSGVRIE